MWVSWVCPYRAGKNYFLSTFSKRKDPEGRVFLQLLSGSNRLLYNWYLVFTGKSNKSFFWDVDIHWHPRELYSLLLGINITQKSVDTKNPGVAGRQPQSTRVLQVTECSGDVREGENASRAIK